MHLRQSNRLNDLPPQLDAVRRRAAVNTTTAWSTEVDAKPLPAPTFNRDIAPIMFAQCASCHRPGEAAALSLLTYKQVSKRADLVAAVTDSRFMPPWHAEQVDVAYHGERRLTDEQIASIKLGSPPTCPRAAADLPAAPNSSRLAAW